MTQIKPIFSEPSASQQLADDASVIQRRREVFIRSGHGA
jgi:hypothetical protein